MHTRTILESVGRKPAPLFPLLVSATFGPEKGSSQNDVFFVATEYSVFYKEGSWQDS